MKATKRMTAAEFVAEEKKRLTIFARYRTQIAPGSNTEVQWREIFRRHCIRANTFKVQVKVYGELVDFSHSNKETP
jgi:hypothetical protein